MTYPDSALTINYDYDVTGNVTAIRENGATTGVGRLTSYSYDPLGRLKSTSSTTAPLRNFAYDGLDLIAELDDSSLVQHRYVHGPSTDNPIIWYNGSLINNTTRRFLMADERGSIISVADSSGSTVHINSYDEYGIVPQLHGGERMLGTEFETEFSEVGW